MADPSPYDSNDDTDVGPGGSTTGTPRWVKVFGIVALAVVFVVVILLLTGRGNHGPDRHASSGGADRGSTTAFGQTPPSAVAHAEQQP